MSSYLSKTPFPLLEDGETRASSRGCWEGSPCSLHIGEVLGVRPGPGPVVCPEASLNPRVHPVHHSLRPSLSHTLHAVTLNERSTFGPSSRAPGLWGAKSGCRVDAGPRDVLGTGLGARKPDLCCCLISSCCRLGANVYMLDLLCCEERS